MYKIHGSPCTQLCVCESISNANCVEILYETLSLTVRVSQSLGMLGELFGLKRFDVIGDPRKLHKNENHNIFSRQLLLGYTIKWAKMVDTCDTYIRVEVSIQNSS